MKETKSIRDLLSAPHSIPAFDSTIAVFSYEKDRIIYHSVDMYINPGNLHKHRERVCPDAISNIASVAHDDNQVIFNCKDSALKTITMKSGTSESIVRLLEPTEEDLESDSKTEDLNVVPYIPAERFYVTLVIEAFVKMRQSIDRNGDTDKVKSKSMMVKGYHYDLMALTTHTERYGKVCIFTCHHKGYRKESAVRENKNWYRELFKQWYANGLQEPDPRFWNDEMWCIDVSGKTVEEIVSTNVKNTPAGYEPISDLLTEVMQPGVLEASEVRTGYPPVCLSVVKAAQLDLLFVQRFRLMGRDDHI